MLSSKETTLVRLFFGSQTCIKKVLLKNDPKCSILKKKHKTNLVFIHNLRGTQSKPIKWGRFKYSQAKGPFTHSTKKSEPNKIFEIKSWFVVISTISKTKQHEFIHVVNMFPWIRKRSDDLLKHSELASLFRYIVGGAGSDVPSPNFYTFIWRSEFSYSGLTYISLHLLAGYPEKKHNSQLHIYSKSMQFQ